ncbi:MAG: hypothetical protein SFU87_13235 [Chitinophagaceae bacterium]|nr:hypothetical protein [Chitinophagaceae bacterium]
MKPDTPVQRPVIITALCVALFAIGLFTVFYTFTGAFAPYGLLYSAGNVLLLVITFAALSGVWGMEKWGTWLFAVVIALKLSLDVWVKAFTWWELLLLVPAFAFLFYYKKMK